MDETADKQARWRRRPEERPAEILKAALAVFSERGFSAARMEEIARRAGVSKGTLYLYFPGKEQVFEALVREAVLPNLDRLQALAAGHQGSAAALLTLFLRRARAVLTSPEVAAFPRLILGEAGNFPELAAFWYREVVQRTLGLLGSVIERGIAAGEFRPVDPRSMAKLIMAPLLLLAIWHGTFAPLEQPPMDVDSYLDLHLQTLLAGLAPPVRP